MALIPSEKLLLSTTSLVLVYLKLFLKIQMCEVYSTSLILHFHIKMFTFGWMGMPDSHMIGVTVSIKLTQSLKAI